MAPQQPARGTLSIDPPAGDGSAFGIRLSVRVFRCVWCLIFVIYWLNGFFCVTIALVYWFGARLRQGYYVEYIGLLEPRYMPLVALVFLVSAFFHWRALVGMIVHSVRHRQLLFMSPEQMIIRSAMHSRRSKRNLQQSEATAKTHKQRTGRRQYPSATRISLRRAWSQCFSRQGLFGIEGSRFEVSFVVRELMEIILQTYQAYKASHLLTEAWINQLIVAVLVANCWATPFVYYVFLRHLAWQRFFYLWSDIILDFCAAVIVPVLIFYKKTEVLFSSQNSKQYFDMAYTDIQLMQTIMGAQQVFVQSWLDFLSKLMPFFSMISCLRNVKLLLIACQTPPVASKKSAIVSDSKWLFTRRSLSVVPIGFDPATTAAQKNGPNAQTTTSARRYQRRRTRHIKNQVHLRGHELMHVLFVLWGLIILAVHITARGNSIDAVQQPDALPCKAITRPWFRSKLSCAVLVVNCYRRNISGTSEELDATLANVEALSLMHVIFEHCPSITMPARVRTFSGIIGIEINNSTLIEWSADAALTESAHPAIRWLNLVCVNLTALPPGVLSHSSPSGLRDIQLIATNLTTLPSDLHTRWKRLLNLYVENGRLSAFPETIGALELERLSLFNNDITFIPDTLLANRSFRVLSIAKNPITTLPSTIGSLDVLKILLLDNTSVATAPAWLTQNFVSSATVSAGATPLCEALSLTSSSLESSLGRLIECTAKGEDVLAAYSLQRHGLERTV